MKNKKIGCSNCMVDFGIPIAECVDSRQYCDAIMQRYIVLLDNATYMPCEHIQKEKEYGIPWRSAFKQELYALVNGLAQKLISSQGFEEGEDPFEVLHKVVKKDTIDAATFDAKTQAELMVMLIENLELLEKCVY